MNTNTINAALVTLATNAGKKAMAFISRHESTEEQLNLAVKAGYALIHVGDCDAFDTTAIRNIAKDFVAVAVVHPAAMELVTGDGYATIEASKPHVVAVDEGRSALRHDTVTMDGSWMCSRCDSRVDDSPTCPTCGGRHGTWETDW